jgi:hypothetical protein
VTAKNEQETTITFIRTSDLRVLRRLRSLEPDRDFLVEVRGGSDWGEFTCDAENFYLFSALRAKRTVSEAERAKKTAHLERLRADRDSEAAA